MRNREIVLCVNRRHLDNDIVVDDLSAKHDVYVYCVLSCICAKCSQSKRNRWMPAIHRTKQIYAIRDACGLDGLEQYTTHKSIRSNINFTLSTDTKCRAASNTRWTILLNRKHAVSAQHSSDKNFHRTDDDIMRTESIAHFREAKFIADAAN